MVLSPRAPSAACDEAFADITPDAEERTIEGRGSLLDLGGTVTACESYLDWHAGAAAHRDALPQGLDPDTALRSYCRSAPDEERDAPPCRTVTEITSSGGV